METQTLSSCFSLSASIIIFLLIIIFQQICCDAKHHPPCPSSSCAKISNITSPFRLKSYPNHCGDKKLELDCVQNGSVLTLLSGTYHVNNINYTKYTISLSDAGVVEDATCSFIPRNYLDRSFNDFDADGNFFNNYFTSSNQNYSKIAYLNCTNPVMDDRRYVKVNMGYSCGFGRHVYAVWMQDKADWKPMMTVTDIKVGCSLILTTVASKKLSGIELNGGVSYSEIHKGLIEGLEVSWLPMICNELCGTWDGCEVVNESSGEVTCTGQFLCSLDYGPSNHCGIFYQIRDYIRAYLSGVIIGIFSRFSTKDLHSTFHYFTDGGIFMGRNILPSLITIKYLFGVVLWIILLIYKWRRRHLSMYEEIENFLQDNNLNPIRYGYKEIKKMTGSFKVKLGQGGYGSVYKGKLRSGPDVAIKVLNKFNPNGQDFISEVSTIGRIHHWNVVRLIGYCVEGKIRALVYEFMPNGSLDKYIFSKEGTVSLSYQKIYEISLGIAHGIAYLHQGCDMQILHFDIKPHNILLDENFIPKVSDFGLAKLYPIDDSIVTLTGARGTLGYMAPELFYRNVGGISYKVDVYSFGMLLMEMTSKRRNSNPNAERSSQVYFPFWIYDQFNEEKNIEMIDLCEEEDRTLAKKMFIVALWCIQLKPNDRPSMTKVVEMLEGDVESIQMPPKPSFYPEETFKDDDEINSDQTSWIDSYISDSYGQSEK